VLQHVILVKIIKLIIKNKYKNKKNYLIGSGIASNNCLSCFGTLSLDSKTSTCVSNCPTGFYPSNNICKAVIIIFIYNFI
jgi:hypothetical protein